MSRNFDTRRRSEVTGRNVAPSTTHRDEISTLIDTLSRAQDILRTECSTDDKVGRLSLALLKKELLGLAVACDLVKPLQQDSEARSDRREPDQAGSRPHLSISTSSDTPTTLPSNVQDARSPSLDPPARHSSAVNYRQAPSHSSRHDRNDKPSHRSQPPSRRPPSPAADLSSVSPPLLPSYPPLPSSRASSRRDHDHSSRSSDLSSRPRDRSDGQSAREPTGRQHDRRAQRSRSSRGEVLSGGSDAERPKAEERGGARPRARSVSARSFVGRRDQDEQEVRRTIPEPSAPPFEPEPIVLEGEKVFKSIAEALMVEDDGVTTVSALSLVCKDSHTAVQPVLYGVIAITSLRQARNLNRTLGRTSQVASLVRKIEISPLDANSTITEVLPVLQTLLSHSTSVLEVVEDISAGDWDVTSLQNDYLLPIGGPGSKPQLGALTSARCWWELSAIIALLVMQSPTLSSLKLAAAMDREWSALTQPPLSPPSSLRSLQIGSVMHEDTLACILRSTPSLRSLAIGFTSIGSSDDDTPRKSIPLALQHVAQSLHHLAIRAAKKGDQDTTGLLDEIMAELPMLEVLEFEETTEAKLASKNFLSELPKTLKVLRGRRISSFGSARVLDMLDEAEGIPVLLELDLKWASEGGDGAEVYKSRHTRRIEEGCEELGIKGSVGISSEALVLGTREV